MGYFVGGIVGFLLGATWGWRSWRKNVLAMREELYEYEAEACERVGLPPPPRGFDSLRMHPKSAEVWKREKTKR